MEQERAFKGIWIPREIWLSKTLTMQEKIMLVEIDSLDNEKGCFANNKYFADFFGISKTRVSIVIKNLIDKGFLISKLQYKEGTKQILNRVLNICRPPYPTFVKEGYLINVIEPIQQKLKDNNTINNTSINNTINKENSGFQKPKLEEIKNYCIERKNDVDADNFFDFYESKGWKIGKEAMKDWKACIRTWERRSNKGNNSSFLNNMQEIYSEEGGDIFD